ncbi:MAG: hypothetical protein IKQ00_04370 [Butyrivibrio sp.]|nr:hypothetical protein [Butyrivibrio sp.]
MKKGKSIAILLASSMMLSFVGCAGSSSDASTGSSTMELTEEELIQAAREAMVASEDDSSDSASVDSSIDASTVASSAATGTSVEASATAVSSDTTIATTATSIPDASTTATSVPEAATTATSTLAASTGTAVETQAQTQAEVTARPGENDFVYNGKVISVMSDTDTIMSNLGQYQSRNTSCPEQPYYVYDSGRILFITGIKDGKELPVGIAISGRKDIKTSRGIGVGSTLAEVNMAYKGFKQKESFSLNKDYGIKVTYNSCSLYFYFNTNNDTVTSFCYDNDDTLSKMYPVKKDIKESTQNIVVSGGSKTATSNSTANTVQATTTPANNTTATTTTTPATNTQATTTPAPAPAPAATPAQNTGSLAEYEIMYNGKKLSVLDGASTVMANLGQCEKKDTSTADEPRYVYDSGNVNFYTFINNGEELSYDLCIYKQGAKTSRNVGVGDSKDKIIAAYGNPSETYKFTQGYGLKYKFDKFTLYFDFDSSTDRAYTIVYGNNDTIAKRHSVHSNYIGD